MPILKGVKVDHFENVTILQFSNIAFREKITRDGHIEVAVAEMDKLNDEVLIHANPVEGKLTVDVVANDSCSHLDMIIDIPDESSLNQFIEYFTKLKEYYREDEDNKS